MVDLSPIVPLVLTFRVAGTLSDLPRHCDSNRVTSRMDPFKFTLLVKTLLKFPLYNAPSYRKFLIRHGCRTRPRSLGILHDPGLTTPRLLTHLANEVLPIILELLLGSLLLSRNV